MKSLIPSKGEKETTIKRLIDYITKQNPDFISNIEGVSDKTILNYYNFTKYKLPIAYLNYLQVMGLNNNGLFPEIVDFNLIEIIDFYKDISVSGPETLNSKLPIIGLYDIGDEISFDLSYHLNNPRVVYSASGDLIEILSLTFENYLMKYALKYVETRKRMNGIWYSSNPNNTNKHIPLQNELSILVKKMELTEVWFSDKITRIYVNRKMSLFAEIKSKNSILITIFYDNQFPTTISKYIDEKFGTTGLNKINYS